MTTLEPLETAQTAQAVQAAQAAQSDDMERSAARAHDQQPPRLLSWLGGASLLTAPLLILGAIATIPPKASDSPADYVASMAGHPLLTSVSASLFHYGWVLFALGALSSIGLLRGSRGRILVVVGALGTALGAIQMSGLLLLDWYTVALGQNLSSADAVRVDQAFGDTATDIWFATAKIGALLLPLVLFLGLARAGVLPWWITPLCLGAMIVPPLLPLPLGLLAGLVCWTPTLLTGLRLLTRARNPR